MMGEPDRIYVMTDNSGNMIIEHEMTKQMISAMETRGVQITIYTPWQRLKDKEYQETQQTKG